MNKCSTDEYYKIAAKGSCDTAHPAMRILKTLADGSNKILDLGCGEGTRLDYLSPRDGWGVDISSQAIALAKKKYPKHYFLVGDLTRLPFREEKFDLIYSAFVFEHLERPEKAIGEALRFLSPGGKLVIIAPNYGAPNRASPPFRGNRFIKLFKGLSRDFSKSSNLSWEKVKPITTKEKYDIDWDTTCEPYLGSLIRYFESLGLRPLYASSCWSEELPGANLLQKTIKYLGVRGIFPFRMWGPHLIVAAQKGVEKNSFQALMVEKRPPKD